MMDIDEALEHVLQGEIVSRPHWGPDEVLYRYFIKQDETMIPFWRTTRTLATPDMVAEDWFVVGTLQ